MDEQNSPSTEPPTATLDPVVNAPTAEPQQTEPVQATAEQTPVPSADATPEQAQQTVTPTEPIAGTQTAQMAGSEPLPEPQPASAPSAVATAEAQQPETSTPTQGSASQPEPIPTPVQPVPASMPAQAPAVVTPPRNLAHLFLEKAKAVIQLHKQKKLVKIMSLFEKKKHITNDEVEKLLHVSDATATRYLSHLERQGKIKQTGKTGKGVTYTKV